MKISLEELELEPLDDADIKYYLPDSKIIVYSDLQNVNNIEDLLPRNNTYFILLYQLESKNSGHWAILSRIDDVIEYFDSYGKPPDYPIKHWAIDQFKNIPHQLSHILDKTNLIVVCNTICFQNMKIKNMSTCGAYAVMRALALVEYGSTLGQFNVLLQELKPPNLTYDELIVGYISQR
jgi:hypothetical protein